MTFLKKQNSILWLVQKALIPTIITLGIALRLVLFFQNRNLIIDEANIARNLAERDFSGLLQPLSYEQYAPPLFLWMEKISSLLFGYGEKAMRLYPLLCGIAALFVLYKVASLLMRKEGVWLPLALFSFGEFFIEYSATVKQYMPDALVAMLLIWAALTVDYKRWQASRFTLVWIVIGSMAIWSSMPSVFILAGVGCYYAWPILKARKWSALGSLTLIATAWILQFGCYYLFILKAQINSPYLQNFHREYFLYLSPTTAAEWLHNWIRLEGMVGNIGGFTIVSLVVLLVLGLLGMLHLLRSNVSRFLLVALPWLLVILAALLKQFSLIERVILFTMPLYMLLMGIGMNLLWRNSAAIKTLIIAGGIWCVASTNAFWLLYKKLAFHELTDGLAWVQQQGGTGPQLYVHNASDATYLYYTGIHPNRNRWTNLKGAKILSWKDDYSLVTQSIQDTVYFIYTGGFPIAEKDKRTAEITTNLQQTGYFQHAVCFVYQFAPKP